MLLCFAAFSLIVTIVNCVDCTGFKSNSQDSEEEVMNQVFFKNKNNGVYVEIGALDGLRFSNTLKLHHCYNWTGILIEGMKSNFERLQENVKTSRPDRVEIHYGAVCSPPTTTVSFVVGLVDATNGDAGEMSDSFKKRWTVPNSETIETPCFPMKYFLKNQQHIDFFSLDVEGAELTAIETIDFSTTEIDVFMIELDNHNLHRNYKVRQVLFSLGYKECVQVVARSAVFVSKKAYSTLYKCPNGANTVAHVNPA